jgi:hypothetical protein
MPRASFGTRHCDRPFGDVRVRAIAGTTEVSVRVALYMSDFTDAYVVVTTTAESTTLAIHV